MALTHSAILELVKRKSHYMSCYQSTLTFTADKNYRQNVFSVEYGGIINYKTVHKIFSAKHAKQFMMKIFSISAHPYYYFLRSLLVLNTNTFQLWTRSYHFLARENMQTLKQLENFPCDLYFLIWSRCREQTWLSVSVLFTICIHLPPTSYLVRT